ncbi:MAG TPA: NADH-quinone oxidoreductase subunit M [Rectinemataceae bacterium]|nr:NADH-quinone oxidoreductase subunit M [Rectinemataceae bacterium]
MTLSLFIIVPLVAALVMLAAGPRRSAVARWACLLANAINLVIAVLLWVGSTTGKIQAAEGSWLLVESHPWIPAFGISLTLGLDGLSLLFVSLTAVLGLAAVLSSWKGIQTKVLPFHLALAVVLAGINGVFLSLDLFLFAFMWELMLIPMYFLIDLWGHEGRHHAAIKFFLFTQIGGLLMFVAIIGLYLIHGRASGNYSFDYRVLLGTALGPVSGMVLMLGFFAAFAVKLPAFPLHAWLPDAHTEAPTAGSVILAGLLLKTGGYGLIRFVLPLFPDPSRLFAPVAMWIGVAGIVYGGFMAFTQSDLKRLVAYTSVSHLGFVLLGVFALNSQGISGAVIQMLSHGLGTGALFILVGGLQDRIHTRDIARMGGIWSQAPRMGAFALVLTLALLGLPGLGNFIGEFLVLLGSYRVNPAVAIVAGLGLVVAMVYALRMFQLAFHGGPREKLSIPDLGALEMATLGGMVAGLFWLGLYPQGALRLLGGLAAGLGLAPGALP